MAVTGVASGAVDEPFPVMVHSLVREVKHSKAAYSLRHHLPGAGRRVHIDGKRGRAARACVITRYSTPAPPSYKSCTDCARRIFHGVAHKVRTPS